jgi:triosephosphate isomerase (TIM)
MADNSTQRRPLIAGNWKMYKTPRETEAYLKEFLPKIPADINCDIVICPPYTSLQHAGSLMKGSKADLGAQNVNENPEGAFTGEISPAMLAETGCKYVVIGHSERRQFFGETNAGVNRKMLAVLKQGLIPIVCVGETLAERDANSTLAIVDRQVKEALVNIPSADTQKIVIAYEPVWAIGTGRTATPQQAQEVHLAIRDILKDQYGSLTSLSVRILYGGSVKPDNMADLMACEDIDGGLVGGASLKPESFLDIVNYRQRKPAGR